MNHDISLHTTQRHLIVAISELEEPIIETHAQHVVVQFIERQFGCRIVLTVLVDVLNLLDLLVGIQDDIVEVVAVDNEVGIDTRMELVCLGSIVGGMSSVVRSAAVWILADV